MNGRKRLVELNDKVELLPQEEIPYVADTMQMVHREQDTNYEPSSLEAPEMRQIIELNEDWRINEN